MMMTSAYILLTMLPILMLSSKNPMKMLTTILAITSLMFLKMSLEMTMVWGPMIFFLIFMGGVMIMFMIVSSALPNSGNIKLTKTNSLLILTIITILGWKKSLTQQSIPMAMKTVVSENPTFQVMVVMILLYFFVAMEILTLNKEKSMRSVS